MSAQVCRIRLSGDKTADLVISAAGKSFQIFVGHDFGNRRLIVDHRHIIPYALHLPDLFLRHVVHMGAGQGLKVFERHILPRQRLGQVFIGKAVGRQVFVFSPIAYVLQGLAIEFRLGAGGGFFGGVQNLAA